MKLPMRWIWVLVMAGGSIAARAGSEPAHTVYRYKGAGWDWGAAAISPLHVARQSALPSGGARIVFTVPDSIAPMGRPGVRAGLVNGQPGAAPGVWLTVGRPWGRRGGPSPLGGLTFGGAMLLRAEVAVDAGVTVTLDFDGPPDFRSAWDLYVLLDTDADPATGYMGGEYLLQDVTLGGGGAAPAGLQATWFEARPGITVVGQSTVIHACVLNATGAPLQRARVELTLPPGVRLVSGRGAPAVDLAVGEARRFAWRVAACTVGTAPLRLSVAAGDRRVRRLAWLTTVAHRNPQREYVTREGVWLPFPSRPTLQQGNHSALLPLAVRTSAGNRRNLFGITAHLPRTTDGEDPFAVNHAIDGNPATCWASRWWRLSTPISPEWIEFDLGSVRSVAGFRWLAAWKGGGAPASALLEASADGRVWAPVSVAHDVPAPADPPRWSDVRFAARPARWLRFSAARLRQGATSFFCAPYEPFQFRLAEVEALDAAGAAIRPRTARASSVFHAWYNDPATITKTWPLLFRSGVKLNRVGQWGDKIDWSTVERRKGVLRVDPEVDRGISESVRRGVEILMTLDYGNSLYQSVKSAPDFGPTWHRGHPFLQCGPTSPEAVAGFARYCGYMARHFRGRVRYFEIWNEENGWFFDDWAENGKVSMARAYGRALRAAARAVKEANPEAIVVFGGTAGMAPDFVRVALEEGAGPDIDVVAFHPYGHPTPEAAADNFLTRAGDTFEWKPRPADQPTYEAEIAALRQMLLPVNPKMQIWANEMNWMAPGEPGMAESGDQSELSQAKYLARFFTQNAWLGCGAIWWSLYNANGVQEWAVVRSADCTPRPALLTSAAVATVLDDVQTPPRPLDPAARTGPPAVMARVFHDRAGRPIMALWRTSAAADDCVPQSVTADLPKWRGGWEIVDPLYGVRQAARTSLGMIPGVLVGDWPVFVRGTR